MNIIGFHEVNEYLYNLKYSAVDYEKAAEYFSKVRYQPPHLACSSFYKNGLVGRNLDWTYDNSCIFLVRTLNTTTVHKDYNDFKDNKGEAFYGKGHYATLGICGSISKLVKGTVSINNPLMDIIPFYLQDGINEYGVYCSMNVVPTDYGITYSEDPDAMCTLMIPRYVIDNFDTADKAIEALRNLKFFSPNTLSDQGYELHFFIADKQKSYVVEFINSQINVLESDKLTNFFLTWVDYTASGKVYTPEDVLNFNFPSTHGITHRGSGLERYNIMVDMLPTVTNKTKAKELLQKLNFTNTYKPETQPYWYSEFAGISPTVYVDTPPTDPELKEIVNHAQELYKNRKRDGSTWHTVHSSIYDLNNFTLTLLIQEQPTEYNYSLNTNSTELSFTKEDHCQYVELYVEGTFNLHIEKSFSGYISVLQKNKPEENYDTLHLTYNNVLDKDFDLLTYPKYIRVEVVGGFTSVEAVNGQITLL